jgi:hypothetical protein
VLRRQLDEALTEKVRPAGPGSGLAWRAEPFDPGLDCGQALGGSRVQELGLLIEVGGGFDPKVTGGQPAGDELQGGQQLLEGQGLERTFDAAQLGVEVQPGEV